MGNTYNRVYIWCCKYGENCYCERYANKKWCASKHTSLLKSSLGKSSLHPYLVIPLISARVTLISTRVSAHCQAILLGQFVNTDDKFVKICRLVTNHWAKYKIGLTRISHSTSRIHYVYIWRNSWYFIAQKYSFTCFSVTIFSSSFRSLMIHVIYSSESLRKGKNNLNLVLFIIKVKIKSLHHIEKNIWYLQ